MSSISNMTHITFFTLLKGSNTEKYFQIKEGVFFHKFSFIANYHCLYNVFAAIKKNM